METSVKLEPEGIRSSVHVRRLINDNIDKLENHFGHITAARVAIRAPSGRRGLGGPYLVSVWLSLPQDRSVAVTPPSNGLDPRHGDVAFAVSDAFRRAGRQLGSEASKMKERRQKAASKSSLP